MTRKDYVLIAAAIKAEKDELANNAQSVRTLQLLANRLASALYSDNARFDTQRFVTACGF